jgi:hypothetical protein
MRHIKSNSTMLRQTTDDIETEDEDDERERDGASVQRGPDIRTAILPMQ